MNQINQQVARARRRVVTGKFFSMLSWAAFVGLLIAVVGLAIPKIWHLGFLDIQANLDAWVYGWIIGGTTVGFLAAALVTWKTVMSRLDVAVQVDKRFELKERLSSAMSLDSKDAQSNVGRALLKDAEDRAELIDVRDQFEYKLTWRALLPLIPIAILACLMFVPNAEKKVVAIEPTAVDQKRVEVKVEEFKKKLKEQRERLMAKGLKDADKSLKPLEEKLDKLLEEGGTDKKQALVKLNDIKKAIEDRQKELGSSKEMRENLNKLKDISKGPAKKLADAMSQGDMEAAKKAIKQLADKLKSGDLSKVELKKLAKDMENMAKELQKIADKHKAAKKKLKDAIKKAVENGDIDEAAKLQQKLDELKKKDAQQEKMAKMAEKLQKCGECMKPAGDGPKKQGKNGKQQPGQPSEQQADAAQKAGESLEELAEQIEGLQKEMQELEALEDLQEMAEGCKNAMQGQGQGQSKGAPQWRDMAEGEGAGGGKRGLEKEDTGTFKSRQKGQLQKGQTVVTGDADGENITGRSVSETRELVNASISDESDPLQNLKLPKARREHGAEYFKNLRDNN